MKSTRRILKAHHTLAKMFYRRNGSTSIITADGNEGKFDPKSDLYYLSSRIIASDRDFLEKSPSDQESTLIDRLSGVYSGRFVQWTTSLNNPEVQRVLAKAKDLEVDLITVIYTVSQTIPSKTLIDQACKATDIQFESFSVDNLVADIIEHRMVPPHRLVSDPKERAEILKGYSIDEDTLHKLPSITTEDAVCRYYAFPEGSLIEIIRPGDHIVHRVVTNPKTGLPDAVDLGPLAAPEVVPVEERRYTKYMSPAEYAMAINQTANQINRNGPPKDYLERPERRLLQIAKQMVDEGRSDVVIVRPHINSNKVEHWHLNELVPPKVS